MVILLSPAPLARGGVMGRRSSRRRTDCL